MPGEVAYRGPALIDGELVEDVELWEGPRRSSAGGSLRTWGGTFAWNWRLTSIVRVRLDDRAAKGQVLALYQAPEDVDLRADIIGIGPAPFSKDRQGWV